MTPTIEREIKLRFNSPEEARTAILAAGATPLRDRRLQEDHLLDSKDSVLRERQDVLRIRKEPDQNHLTYKGPAQLSMTKTRIELETRIDSFATLLQILEKLGFYVWFCYQKYREEFISRDIIIAIDETPVGTFVEIEGAESSIVRMADSLGKEPSDYVLDSYLGLFLKHRKEHGLKGPNMVFDKKS